MNYILLNNKLLRLSCSSLTSSQIVKLYSKKAEDNIKIPVNPLKDIYSASSQKKNGIVSDPKPFKILCEKGKNYHWCLCGHSKRQPLCDGTHNNQFMKITLKPIKFTVTETKDYWLCNCKQTKNRPFCDGSHKHLSEELLAKKKY